MNADSNESKQDIMTNKKHTALYKVKISLFKFFFSKASKTGYNLKSSLSMI